MYKILLLEDDEILSATIRELLLSEGYDVRIAKDGNRALDMSFEDRFDLYLLDVNVPFLNGFDFLKELRDSGDVTPAFFITALRDIGSLSQGFKVGADDYIKKPFDFDELLIRISAKLKIDEGVLKYGDIEYDMISGDIVKNGKHIEMAQIDRQIFLLFLKNVGKNVNKERIFDLMDKPTDLALRVHISKIKKLLSVNITNIRGAGYRLEEV